jgi:hypothetical protein
MYAKPSIGMKPISKSELEIMPDAALMKATRDCSDWFQAESERLGSMMLRVAEKSIRRAGVSVTDLLDPYFDYAHTVYSKVIEDARFAYSHPIMVELDRRDAEKNAQVYEAEAAALRRLEARIERESVPNKWKKITPDIWVRGDWKIIRMPFIRGGYSYVAETIEHGYPVKSTAYRTLRDAQDWVADYAGRDKAQENAPVPVESGSDADRVEQGVVGLYETANGKVGMKIIRSAGGGYRYSGAWGAGSTHSYDTMAQWVRNELASRRGVRTVVDFFAPEKAKAPTYAAPKKPDSGLKIGDILSASWGYDQTNVDFYQVVNVKNKTVDIRRVSSTIVKSDRGADYVVPNVGDFIGAVIPNKRPSEGGYVKVSTSRSASPWNGKPMYQTPSHMQH